MKWVVCNGSEFAKTDGEGAAAESAEVLSASEPEKKEFLAWDSRVLESTASHKKFYEDMVSIYKEEIRKKIFGWQDWFGA